MTDHNELLELAAKAAGITQIQYYTWDPIENDGQCARLEADLGIHVCWDFVFQQVICKARYLYHFPEIIVKYGDDKQAARRLASVKVAAEIGRVKTI